MIGLFAVVTLVIYEIGFRVGRWWQDRMPGEQEGPAGVLIGALLGLMAFMLAVVMGMAADRFDARRGMVLAEANAIGKAYLEAGYMPEPQAERAAGAAPRIPPIADRDERPAADAGRHPALDRARTPRCGRHPARRAQWLHLRPDVVAGRIRSTDVVNINESRVVAGVYSRVPETILLLLLGGSALSLGMVGYGAGIAGRRSVVTAVIMVVALGAVLTVVIDLDRPQEGFLRVSQQPLLDVQKWIGTPTP